MDESRYVSIAAAAKAFNYSHSNIYYLARKGVLARRFERNRFLVRLADVVEYAQGHFEKRGKLCRK
jgi:hypothetical protein